jgi:hypothetical protein
MLDGLRAAEWGPKAQRRNSCDYSLMGIPNRLAKDGEKLVRCKFLTGAMELAPPADVKQYVESRPAVRRGFCGSLRGMFSVRERKAVSPVRIPPGARLVVQGIPKGIRRSAALGQNATVIFTHLTADANTYRDAIRFEERNEGSLQELGERQRILVLDLASAAPREAEMAERGPYRAALDSPARDLILEDIGSHRIWPNRGIHVLALPVGCAVS